MRPPWSHEREWERRRPSPQTGDGRGGPRWRRDFHGGNAHRDFPAGRPHVQEDKLRNTNGYGGWNDHLRNRMPSTSMPIVRHDTPNFYDNGCVSNQYQRRIIYQPNYHDAVSVPEQFQGHVMDQASSSNAFMNPDKRDWTWRISPERTLLSQMQKKLLVLDLNGILADVVFDYKDTLKADTRINGKAVFKRPFCEDFMKFCFERFEVGVWSSKKQNNVDEMVNYIMGDMKRDLLFCWDQSKCTFSGFSTVENMQKPLFLKELRKLWNKEERGLPWRRGIYTASNTLLLDDSPYKSMRNPPYTAVFPCAYKFTDEHDCSLGPQGDIRIYLEGLAMANDVQHYVMTHPFGQHPVTPESPSWKHSPHVDQFQYSSVPG